MWRLSLANALAHRSRLALTWLAVALGVAFVTGSLVLTDTSTRLLDRQFRTATAGVDLTVRTAAAFNAAMGVEVQRAPLPPETLAQVSATSGVVRARAVASGPAQLQAHGHEVATSGPTLLSSWATAPYTAYRLRAGHTPTGPTDAVLDTATARAEGIGLGDTITVSAIGSGHLRVVGLAGLADGDGLANTTVVLTDLPTAQSLLGLGRGLSSIDVIADNSVSVPALRDALASSLGKQVAVTSAQDAAAASAEAAKHSITYLRLVLLALAAAGLIVGAFLIANTFAIVLTQRSRELALLRAAGATGRQVLAAVLGEALIVGLTGALSGAIAGVGAAYGLRDLAQRGGLVLPDGPLTVSVATLTIALTAGVAVTLLAALGPARRAARVAPVQAMRGSDAPSGAPRRRRLVTGSLLTGLGLLQLVAAALTHSVGGVGLGALLLLAGLAALAPVLAPRLAQLLGFPLSRAGVPGQLARDSIVRNPRRTAATAAALAVGLALISFVAVLGGSVKAITGSNSGAITAQLLVQSSRQEMLGGLSPEVAARISALPQVAAVSRIRYGHWMDRGMTSVLTAVDPATLGRVATIQMTSGQLGGLATGGVVVAEKVATERHLRVGDELAMTFPRDATQQLPVVGVISDATARALSTNYLISLDSYARHYSENVDAAVYVALSPSVSASGARTAMKAAVADFPNAEVLDESQAAAARAGAVNQVLGLITVLLGFAVLIALLGITNTLALSIVERTRELGLLRAVGMSRRQLAWMVRGEALLISAVAVVAGLALGVGLASATLAGLASDSATVIRLPGLQLAAVLVAALVAGLAAGLAPARRAARLDVLAAIATT
ncbi:MAG: FtsX-like permease family protein [Actinomycetales bacterium]